MFLSNNSSNLTIIKLIKPPNPVVVDLNSKN